MLEAWQIIDLPSCGAPNILVDLLNSLQRHSPHVLCGLLVELHVDLASVWRLCGGGDGGGGGGGRWNFGPSFGRFCAEPVCVILMSFLIASTVSAAFSQAYQLLQFRDFGPQSSHQLGLPSFLRHDCSRSACDKGRSSPLLEMRVKPSHMFCTRSLHPSHPTRVTSPDSVLNWGSQGPPGETKTKKDTRPSGGRAPNTESHSPSMMQFVSPLNNSCQILNVESASVLKACTLGLYVHVLT